MANTATDLAAAIADYLAATSRRDAENVKIQMAETNIRKLIGSTPVLCTVGVNRYYCAVVDAKLELKLLTPAEDL